MQSCGPVQGGMDPQVEQIASHHVVTPPPRLLSINLAPIKHTYRLTDQSSCPLAKMGFRQGAIISSVSFLLGTLFISFAQADYRVLFEGTGTTASEEALLAAERYYLTFWQAPLAVKALLHAIVGPFCFGFVLLFFAFFGFNPFWRRCRLFVVSGESTYVRNRRPLGTL